MSNHLFLFTIGPVQSFIAQARKTQDLYAGSKLLSDLIGYGLCEVSKIKNTEIIFPNFDTTEFKQDCQDSQKIKDRSFPNRFIAKVSIEGNANEFGKSIEVKRHRSYPSSKKIGYAISPKLALGCELYFRSLRVFQSME